MAQHPLAGRIVAHIVKAKAVPAAELDLGVGRVITTEGLVGQVEHQDHVGVRLDKLGIQPAIVCLDIATVAGRVEGGADTSAIDIQRLARGVAPGRLQTISYGKERPIAICSDESCYAQNRRAVTVITAGAGGIGQAIARGFAETGARVHISDIDADAVQAATGGAFSAAVGLALFYVEQGRPADARPILTELGRRSLTEREVTREELEAAIEAAIAELYRGRSMMTPVQANREVYRLLKPGGVFSTTEEFMDPGYTRRKMTIDWAEAAPLKKTKKTIMPAMILPRMLV